MSDFERIHKNLGIVISYDDINLKEGLDCWIDLEKEIGLKEVNEDELEIVEEVIQDTIIEKIFGGVFLEMEKEIIKRIYEWREKDDK
tara:strand:- start:312 stop:572 length:261 start_codon:yes stop_codon:yes gene_type:complete